MNDQDNTPARPAGWESLPPAHLPRPTIAPVGLALGTTFLFWSLITSPMILAAGIGLFAAGLFAWIAALRHERK